MTPILEELLHASPPVDTARLAAAQDRERADRNAETLTAWYVASFGDEVGRVLADEHMRGLL